MSGSSRISRWLASERIARIASLASPSDRSIERIVRLLLLFAAAAANLSGAIAVFVISVWILPTREISGELAPIGPNLALAAAYTAVALPLGAWWALRRLRPGRRWLQEERAPTDAEQRNLLRAPLHVFFVIATLWGLAALLFGAYNTAEGSLELGQRVAITVALAGLTTCAVGYLLTERLLRPAAARALAERPLESPALPGVTSRTLFAWGLGSGIPMIGVAMVAASALIEQDFSRNELAIAALGLSVGGIAVGLLAILLAARVTAAPINSVRRAIDDVQSGELDAEVPVYDGTEVGMLQSGFNRMVEGLRERERIRELFGMHVGEDVARSALERESGLGGETREVAVLFVDIIGSTTIAAERPAEQVVSLLNSFFGLVVRVIEANHGWVNKFEGDAALAIFGAPEPLDDAAGKALCAGRELAKRLVEEVPQAAAGIGISYGRVVAGNIGSEHRFEYTVIGDAVNEAARLTEVAKGRPGYLTASAAAVEAASGDEAARWMLDGEVELRGRARPTRLASPETAAPEEPGPVAGEGTQAAG